jgi:putative membrane protein
MHYYQFMNGNDWMVGIFGIVFWALVFTAIVVLIIRLAKYPSESGFGNNDKSIEIAKMRYAKGEIDKREFEQIKKDLSE